MMYLNFMRHAKSDLNDDVDDFFRPITTEGVETTKKISNFLKKNSIYFDLIFCSPAVRTRQTLDCLIENLKTEQSKIINDYNLYEGNEDNFLLRISNIRRSKNVLVITHEPQILYFINYFLEHTENNNFDFVNSSLITLEFNISEWNELSNLNVKLKKFLDPNKLI